MCQQLIGQCRAEENERTFGGERESEGVEASDASIATIRMRKERRARGCRTRCRAGTNDIVRSPNKRGARGLAPSQSRGAYATAISPETAVERFMRDPAFFHLRNKDAVVEVKSVTFGYYSLTPTDFQRLYPVWAVEATCQTRELRHDFTRYVVAVDMTPEEAKQADVVANPRACRMF